MHTVRMQKLTTMNPHSLILCFEASWPALLAHELSELALRAVQLPDGERPRFVEPPDLQFNGKRSKRDGFSAAQAGEDAEKAERKVSKATAPCHLAFLWSAGGPWPWLPWPLWPLARRSGR